MIDLSYAITNSTMINSDKACIERGTPSVTLMYRAGQAIFDNIPKKEKIYIICGKGNNGGDGYALAYIAMQDNIDTYVFELTQNVSEDAKYYRDKLLQQGYKNIKNINECDYDCNVLVDCIFGTGFKGEPTEEYKSIIQKINSSKAYKVSADIPSGLNGTSGIACFCVKADKTIAIQSIKTGHLLNDGKDFCGELIAVDIGIPIIGEKIKIIDDSDVMPLFEKRKNNSNKGSYGKSVLIGGCTNYAGAIKMAHAGQCALRMGAGLNTLCVPKSLAVAYAGIVEESTLYPLSDIDGHIIFNAQEVDDALNGATSVTIGMGLGSNYQENFKIIDYILKNKQCNLILDADALNSLKGKDRPFFESKCNVLITPHAKEMVRLIDKNLQYVLSNPIQIAQNYANENHCTVLLKGASTVITDGIRTSIVSCGSPCLAKGGSGDTLSGVISGLSGRCNDDLYQTASVGAYLCAKASCNVAEIYGDFGVLASDVAKEIAIMANKIVSNAKN